MGVSLDVTMQQEKILEIPYWSLPVLGGCYETIRSSRGRVSDILTGIKSGNVEKDSPQECNVNSGY